MDMSPPEFWNMPPALFTQKVEGYFRRENRAGLYFRETFTLHANINRKQGSVPVTGYEILPLLGEKKPRGEASRKRSTTWTLAEMAEAAERTNAQVKREREEMESAIADLEQLGIATLPERKHRENDTAYTERLNRAKEAWETDMDYAERKMSQSRT